MSDRNFIITGKTNTAHISSADDGSLYGALFGDEDYVLTTLIENPLAISFTGQTVTVGKGDFVMQGRFGRIVEPDDIVIETPSAGTARYSDVCIQYLKNVAENVEQMSLVVVNGQEKSDAGNPAEPVLTKGNIFDGDTQREIRVCRVLADTRSGTTTFTLVSDTNEFIPLSKVYVEIDDHFDIESTNPIMNKLVTKMGQDTNKHILTYEDIVCEQSWWVQDTTHTNYLFRCDIPIPDCTEDHFPVLIFGYNSPYKSEICQTPRSSNGKVSIWSKQQIDNLPIKTIKLERRIDYGWI